MTCLFLQYPSIFYFTYARFVDVFSSIVVYQPNESRLPLKIPDHTASFSVSLPIVFPDRIINRALLIIGTVFCLRKAINPTEMLANQGRFIVLEISNYQ